MLEDRAVIQGHLSRLKEWTNRNLMKLNKDLHLGSKNRFQQYQLEIGDTLAGVHLCGK